MEEFVKISKDNQVIDHIFIKKEILEDENGTFNERLGLFFIKNNYDNTGKWFIVSDKNKKINQTYIGYTYSIEDDSFNPPN